MIAYVGLDVSLKETAVSVRRGGKRIWRGKCLQIHHPVGNEPAWSLDVENEHGTSTVWDDPFATDDAAYAAFRQNIYEEGMRAFLDQAVVIPFRRQNRQRSRSFDPACVNFTSCRGPTIGLVSGSTSNAPRCRSIIEMRTEMFDSSKLSHFG
jgi:hypothetical protein